MVSFISGSYICAATRANYRMRLLTSSKRVYIGTEFEHLATFEENMTLVVADDTINFHIYRGDVWCYIRTAYNTLITIVLVRSIALTMKIFIPS